MFRNSKFQSFNYTILIFLLILSFQIALSDINEDLVKFNGNSIEGFKNIFSTSYYHVEIARGYIPIYIRILIQGTGEKSNINHIISYYQKDKNYEKRAQLAQSFSDQSELFLNKAQIKDEFYFTVECEEYPCSYEYYITEEKNIEINLDNRYSYSYYVTQETKEMNFVICGNPKIPENSIIKGNHTVTIWAKGTKNIISDLDAKNKEKHSKYNAYLVTLDNLESFEYKFKVEGMIGDLINVGVSFFDGTFHNLYSNEINGNTKEISSFLKKDVKNMNCFKIAFTNGDKEDGYISTTNYNNNEIELMFLVTYFPDKNYFKRCLSIYDSNEGFYSFQYIKKNNEKSLNIYPPQLLGTEYSRYIIEKDTIQLIPIKPEYQYEYITYHIKLIQGYKISAYINSCDKYPLCNTNTMIKNSKKFEISDSFSISFSKREIDQFSSSSIDKKQKILLITCENGSHSLSTARSDYNYCLVKINMYTNKNLIYVEPYISNYRYIADDDENSFEIGSENKNVQYMILNIELLSGNINVIAYENKNLEYYIHNKKLLAIIKTNKFKFKIQSIENSFYHINYILKNNIDIDFSYTIGANYLFNVSELSENIIFSNSRISYDYEYNNEKKRNPVFVSFVPNNCEIKVKQTTDIYLPPTELENSEGFYQVINEQYEKNASIYLSSFDIYNFTITKEVTNESQNCFVDVSFYDYSTNFSDAIILESNSPKIFKFSKDDFVSFIIFSYPVSNIDNDILIDFQILEEGKYSIDFYINDENYYNNYELEKSEKFQVKSKDLKSKCNIGYQICKISFRIDSNLNITSFLKINIEDEGSDKIFIKFLNDEEEEEDDDEGDDDKDDDDDDDNKLLIILISIFLILVVLVALAIVFIIFKRKNENLKNSINNVSFGDGILDRENLVNN